MRPHIKDLIARRETDLPKTEFEEIVEIATNSKDVISLGPGEPDFEAPKEVREAAKKSVDRGQTHYSTTRGMIELREEISRKLRKKNGINADPESEIMVTTGSSEALFLASTVLVEPGDKVIMPNPSYMNYIPMTEFMQGKPLYVKLTHENNFDFQIEQIRSKIDKKTHVMILNSPSNPTGRVMKRKEIEEIADIVTEHNMVVFSDEAYEDFVYGGLKHMSIGGLNGMHEKVLSFYTFSKSYAMAGYRVGYVAGSHEIMDAMSRIRLYSTLSNPRFTQEAALEAMRSCGKDIERMRKEYERRGKMMHRRLDAMGDWFKCNEPEGAFYMFPNTEEFGMSSTHLAHMMLEKAKVLVVPGTEFGEFGEGYVRMSYATSYEKIQEAMDRIDNWLRHFS